MLFGWHNDRNDVRPFFFQQLPVVLIGMGLIFGGDSLCILFRHVGHADQCSFRQFPIDPRMVAPHRSDADHGCFDHTCFDHTVPPKLFTASTTWARSCSLNEG